jgi:hypothetical protein
MEAKTPDLATVPGTAALPADAENEALIDAQKTYRLTMMGAILFGLASLFIIMSTRMG